MGPRHRVCPAGRVVFAPEPGLLAFFEMPFFDQNWMYNTNAE